MTERIVTGKKYRILTDEKNDEWDRVSFWTSSEDVECNDGENVEEKTSKLQGVCLTQTLVAGSTSITFSDASITDDCFVDVYTDVYGVNPEIIDYNTTGQMTLTFEEQIVSRFFRKFNFCRLAAGSQPAMLSDSGSISILWRWSMFM